MTSPHNRLGRAIAKIFSFLSTQMCNSDTNQLNYNIERFAITVILIVFIIQVPLIYYYLTSNASTLQSANCQFSTTSIAFAKLHIFVKRSLLAGTKRLCNTFCLWQKSWKKIEKNTSSSCYNRRLIIFSAKFKVLYLRNFNDM